jgi:hypothetical protein
MARNDTFSHNINQLQSAPCSVPRNWRKARLQATHMPRMGRWKRPYKSSAALAIGIITYRAQMAFWYYTP